MFPLSLSLGLIYSTSIHAGVILAFLPLATAILASFYFKQKASLGFWVCAFIGCILIVIYILIHGHEENKKLELSYSDILFCIAVIVAAIGYNFGAKLTKIMVSADVISWALVLALPVHFTLAIYYFPKIDQSDKITIEHLLYQRTGIKDYANADATLTDVLGKPNTKELILKKIENYSSMFEPDTKHEYSNSNYVLLSYILEKIYKEDYNSILNKKIIKVLI